MARRRTKKRTHLPDPNTTKLPAKQSTTGVSQPLNASASQIPKTMVIRIGASEIGPSVSSLVRDVRTMMEPHTASRLRERKSNRLKDYVTMAGPLGVTQLLLFSRSDTGSTNLRIARCPRGPTLHFRINEYSLCKDVRKALRNPKSPGKEFITPPLLVMNNFATPVPANPDGTPGRPPPQDALLISMFQSMFPAISAQRTPISSIRRVLLLNRHPIEKGSSEYVIDVRHYAIGTKSVGVSRPIRRLNAAEKRVYKGSDPLKLRKKGGLPNLGKLEDIADYMLDPAAAAGGYTSESEVEEDAQVEVLNPNVRGMKRKRLGPEKRSIHLTELGPRMTLEMVKIEEGLGDGKTLWHAYEKKTKAEIQELEQRHAKKQAEKTKRKKAQQLNVQTKKEAKEAKKKEKKERKARGEAVEESDDDDEEMWDDEELDELHERDSEGDDEEKEEDEEMEE
ncbi:Brix-domain-containing protein [Wilcoxina mikolae CBS 423.85]|nr:Brix-domain-containing protein [Wilcoxina mikolae CBS 423.85]